jgi:hypothetical protein
MAYFPNFASLRSKFIHYANMGENTLAHTRMDIAISHVDFWFIVMTEDYIKFSMYQLNL